MKLFYGREGSFYPMDSHYVLQSKNIEKSFETAPYTDMSRVIPENLQHILDTYLNHFVEVNRKILDFAEAALEKLRRVWIDYRKILKKNKQESACLILMTAKHSEIS